MTADPALKERLTRTADLVPVDVDAHLGHLHGDRRARVVRQRIGVFAVTAVVALLAAAVIWRLLPLGTANVPAAPTEPSGTLALMTGSTSQPGQPFNFFDLVSLGIGDGSTVPLERTTDRATFPAWSPDGTKLAYLTGEPPRRVLVVAKADGSEPIDLAAVSTGDGFAWSPDGTQIAYRARSSRDGGNVTDVLAVTNLTGNSRALYVSLAGAWQAFDWSPDGHAFVFTGDPGVPTSQDLTSPPSQLWVQNLDGSGLRRLVGGMTVATPHWSPDGSKIVFACHAAGEERPSHRPASPRSGRERRRPHRDDRLRDASGRLRPPSGGSRGRRPGPRTHGLARVTRFSPGPTTLGRSERRVPAWPRSSSTAPVGAPTVVARRSSSPINGCRSIGTTSTATRKGSGSSRIATAASGSSRRSSSATVRIWPSRRTRSWRRSSAWLAPP
ncbi:MAG: hypothetical protein E6G43_07790 [Actinobacteria bacterium]|nr:MAG: hypothetical protein E6G43_07790 [Actinomycetota bacterium]